MQQQQGMSRQQAKHADMHSHSHSHSHSHKYTTPRTPTTARAQMMKAKANTWRAIHTILMVCNRRVKQPCPSTAG